MGRLPLVPTSKVPDKVWKIEGLQDEKGASSNASREM
jgi:hypothetical protein